jgi:SAM-dependent methyltransferase
VQARYADAAIRAADGEACGSPTFYPDDERATLPDGAVRASLGCGNPLRVADLHPGETVLDLGSGGGIDVLLSARRVGPTGHVHGLDMTDEMLDLARRNAADAGAANVEFHTGQIEAIPLPDASIDVVISNCVINLSADKPAVFAEMFRVLRPGGRVGVSDIVAEDRLTPEQRAERGDWAGCTAGALSRAEYVDGLTAAGFTDVRVDFTGEYADGMHAAIVRARRP